MTNSAPVLYQTNLISKVKTRCYQLLEPPGKYYASRLDENSDEVIEQCLALVKAMIDTQQVNVRESLLFVLEEKLYKLQVLMS